MEIIKNILFYVGTAFPNGAAWSVRAQNLAKVFLELGYNVHIISRFTLKENYEVNDVIEFNGATYQALSNKDSKYSKLYSHFTDFNAIKKYINENEVDVFFSSSVPQMYNKLKTFLDYENIPFYIEQCEWFDPLNFRLKKFDPFYRSVDNAIKNEFHKSEGIVAISTLFEEYYGGKGANVVRIPTILDTQSIEYDLNRKLTENKLKLVFAGNIGGKKELLKPIFEAIREYQKVRAVEFNIYGPSKEIILENIDNDEKLFESVSDSVFVNGKIPQQLVAEKIKEADFMIFLRPSRKSSNAGFPTKFAESLTVGTPVITNLTSDIGLYLENGKNGFVVQDKLRESLINVFSEINQLTEEEYQEMRKHSRATAENEFDYKNYSQQVSSLFKN